MKDLLPGSSNNPITFRQKLGNDIKDINEKFESIDQRARKLGLQKIVARAPVYVASASSQTDSVSAEPIFLGREEDMSSIMDILITAEKKLAVLPIVGMGGQGKTTLARKVFNHDKIKSHFGDNRVWVHVPRIFDVVVLLKTILTSMKLESNVEHGNREALLKMLEEELGAKKYLLLLDDVWNEDREKWDDFERSLSGISSTTGNCMIVTTRSESVASIVGALRVHKLKGLSKDDCWSIIKAKAFGEEDNCPSELEAIGENVAEKCGGSPLAAYVVGGLLLDKSKDEWMSIEKEWLTDFGDENPITKILRLSYDNLPLPSVKKCFAYCSIFSKGYRIEKQQLVELWTAEGFIQALDGTKIFNLLLQNSLLQVLRKDNYGNVMYCNMHDLVHDLAYSVLCERRYIGYELSGDELRSIPEGQERFVRTLFFDGEVSDVRFEDLESLRTLIFVGNIFIRELPTSITKLKHLRYLDISRTRIKYLPDSIGELYHLQTLRAYKFLEQLPDSMSCLLSLRHLHISYNTALPQGIGKLTSLQTLPYFAVGGKKGVAISELGNLKDLKGKLVIRNLENVNDKNEAKSADLLGKAGINELKLVWKGSKEDDESVFKSLQPNPNLKGLVIQGFEGKSLSLWEGVNNLVKITLKHCECEELMLCHLPHLKSLYLHDLESVKSIRFSLVGNIANCRRDTTAVVFPMLERLEFKDMPNLKEWDDTVLFPHLKYLSILGCNQLARAPIQCPCLEELELDERVFKSLQPHPNLKKLVIWGLGKSLSLWEGLNNLVEITLYNCKCEELMLCHLPHLKYLYLHTLPDANVPALEKFDMYSMPYLEEWNEVGSCLKVLEIDGMNSSLPLEYICGIKLTSLTRLIIKDITELECLPYWLFPNNLNLTELMIEDCPMMTHLVPYFGGAGGGPSLPLRKLTISNCPSLRELPDDLHSLNALEKLCIRECPNLKYISSGGGGQQQGFTSLRDLSIWGCEGLTNLPVKMVCTPSLEKLELRELSSITNFPTVFGCLYKMTRLMDLIISEVPKFSIVNTTLNGSLSLQHLDIGPFSSPNDNVSLNETVGAMLQQCISLRSLRLWGMEHCVCLPHQLQHLTSLEILELSDFGIEALPEWFGNLESLKVLRLDNCKKLRHLPPKQAMLRLSKLIDLKDEINNTYELPQLFIGIKR